MGKPGLVSLLQSTADLESDLGDLFQRHRPLLPKLVEQGSPCS